MFEEEEFNSFVRMMKEEVVAHDKVYGTTWKTMLLKLLEERLETKLAEYKLTQNPKKLVSLANLTMMLYIRKTKNHNG